MSGRCQFGRLGNRETHPEVGKWKEILERKGSNDAEGFARPDRALGVCTPTVEILAHYASLSNLKFTGLLRAISDLDSARYTIPENLRTADLTGIAAMILPTFFVASSNCTPK